MMNKNNVLGDDYAFSPVPPTARSNLFSMILIRIGMMTALSQFMLGATLGHTMTFSQALLATFLGSLILEFISLGLGVAGAREGLSTSLLARWCGFGRLGSVLIGVVIAVSLVGWFGVQNAVFAEGLNYVFEGQLGFGWSAVISGMTITGLVAFGFRALSWTAKIAVPLFFVVVGWISLILLQRHNITDLITSMPTGTPLTLGAAATMVAGGYVVASLTTADISRYCQNERHVFWMVTASIIVGEFIVNSIAILIAHALKTDDVVSIMTQTAGWIGLLSVILSAVKINDVNLYSSSLAVANTVEGFTGRKWRHTWLTLALGTIGTTLSIMGILDKFTHFLILLGTIFPPIAGVMLVDYYVLRTSRSLLDAARTGQTLPTSTPLIGWPAICACVAGSAVGWNAKFGIASLNSILVACIVYGVIAKIRASSPHTHTKGLK